MNKLRRHAIQKQINALKVQKELIERLDDDLAQRAKEEFEQFWSVTCGKLESIRDMVSELQDEEQTVIDNLPEGLQNSNLYDTAEAAVDNLEAAADTLDEAMEDPENVEDLIDEAIGYLEDATA